ncbi:hypothetical protein HO133_010795 [Letharia lupina]|uniref:Uncharacterized protein n=1 Tax=Letharia lupina TaxID=560253 RepID=A0A8H6CIH7_9LECA|nr:uncharacterized protein HO133_010795 [Letharia lupina]KAF6224220.1 hypothetical protein HO133_010795 [Letharia lupina]
MFPLSPADAFASHNKVDHLIGIDQVLQIDDAVGESLKATDITKWQPWKARKTAVEAVRDSISNQRATYGIINSKAFIDDQLCAY